MDSRLSDVKVVRRSVAQPALFSVLYERHLLVEQSSSMLGPDLVRALRRLPAADRDALLLVVWGELSYEEAASALGVPIGTVRSRIARARGRLADAIGAAPSSVDPKEAAVNGEARA